MKYQELSLSGAFLIETSPVADDRGSFERLYCKKEFFSEGLATEFVQSNLSKNHFKGTLRGMHFQLAEAAETKLVRCERGSIYDVIVDLNSESATYMDWTGVKLSESNSLMLYVPRGFAHGYLTLSSRADVSYMVDNYYDPLFESGLRYDDPKLNIKWPDEINVISNKDSSWEYL